MNLTDFLKGFPKTRLNYDHEQRLACQIVNDVRRQEAIDLLILHTFREAFYYTRTVCRARIADDDLYPLVYDSLKACAARFQPNRQNFLAYSKASLRGSVKRHWKNIDTLRGSKRVGHSVGEPEAEEEESPNAIGTPSLHFLVDFDFGKVIGDDFLEFVAPIIADLPEVQRFVLERHYFAHKNHAEIGIERGMSREAVRCAHNRALNSIRRRLRTFGHHESAH